MEECIPVEYIDLIIQRGDFNQILYFYDTCRDIRFYLEQPEKLEILSSYLSSKFETFHDFSTYYIRKMVEILSLRDAIEFTVEFYNTISESALYKKISSYNTVNDSINALRNKFRVAFYLGNKKKAAILTKLLYNIQGFISDNDLVGIQNVAPKVIWNLLGRGYKKKSDYISDNGVNLHLISSYIKEGRRITDIARLIEKYRYERDHNEPKFREVLSMLEEMDNFLNVRDIVYAALYQATLSENMQRDRNDFIMRTDNYRLAELFNILIHSEIVNEMVEKYKSLGINLSKLILEADGIAVNNPYKGIVEIVVNTLLYNIDDRSFIVNLESPQFIEIVGKYPKK